jgi:hypothetical protein
MTILLNQIQINEILPKLPDISQLDVINDTNRSDSLFLCALGFEERGLTIPRIFAESNDYSCNEAIYFEYLTNRDDNEINRGELEDYLLKFSKIKNSISCQTNEFSESFRQLISRISLLDKPSITFDISSCTSQIIITVIKILFEFDLNLNIVYSEANVYHPTTDEREQYISQKEEENITLSRGVSKIYIDQEFSGCNIDAQPEALIIFASFTVERTRSIISFIDESLFDSLEERIVWIIGIPHLKEDQWRMDLQRKINNISDSIPSLNISTFHYKETINDLDKEYQKLNCKYHLNISPLGSKMQSIGIALFNYLHPDVTIIFAPPKEYGSKKYTDGSKNIWKIKFGEIKKIRELLDKIGMLEIIT